MSELDFFLDFQTNPQDWGYLKMDFPVEKKVAKEGKEWVVRSSSTGKVLGRHKTKEDAMRQLRAIEANKHGKK
jgi:hypothetical protein